MHSLEIAYLQKIKLKSEMSAHKAGAVAYKTTK